jgi:hypothetical protein
MRRVCGDVNCVSGARDLFGAAKSYIEFSYEQGEGLFEIVTVRWWPASWRDVHVNQAEPACGVFSGKEDGVGISGDSDVGRVAVAFGLGFRKLALRIIGRDR